MNLPFQKVRLAAVEQWFGLQASLSSPAKFVNLKQSRTLGEKVEYWMFRKCAIELNLNRSQHTLKVGNGDGVSIRGFLNPVS